MRTSGLRLARAVYSAAVHPAQPEPMMTTFFIGSERMNCSPCYFKIDLMCERRQGITPGKHLAGGTKIKLVNQTALGPALLKNPALPGKTSSIDCHCPAR